MLSYSRMTRIIKLHKKCKTRAHKLSISSISISKQLLIITRIQILHNKQQSNAPCNTFDLKQYINLSYKSQRIKNHRLNIIMAKSLSNGYKFSGCKHGFGCNKFDNMSPVMVKMMPVFSTFRSNLSLRSTAGGLFGRSVVGGGQERRVGALAVASDSKMGIISIGKSLKWWEKGLQPNMKEITGAEDLVESLLQAGDKLVVVDFFSPGCGGCRALHPKLCQLAEMNPDVQFLQVNYEEHKSMCYSLGVHVLPFFRFYRGSEGRLCSFSCTNATIKKFKDALAKHKPDRCSLGPTKGLEEKELVALGANRDLSFVYDPKPEHPQKEVAPPPLSPMPTVAAVGSGSSSLILPLPLPIPLKSTLEVKEDDKDITLVASGR